MSIGLYRENHMRLLHDENASIHIYEMEVVCWNNLDYFFLIVRAISICLSIFCRGFSFKIWVTREKYDFQFNFKKLFAKNAAAQWKDE